MATASQTISDPRILLMLELDRRCAANPSYSLRAFARAMGTNHTVLSRVINGRRPLSKRLIERLAELIGLDPAKKENLKNQAKRTKTKKQGQVLKYQKLDLDTYALMSDWHHYAILSLLETVDAQANPRWIASRLGIPISQAKISLDLMKRLGILAEVDGKLKQSGPPLCVENKTSADAVRKTVRQLSAKASESFENDAFETRDFSYCTFTMNPRQIKIASQRIQDFRRSLMQELESYGDLEEVYELTIQLFPVSRRRPTSKKPTSDEMNQFNEQGETK